MANQTAGETDIKAPMAPAEEDLDEALKLMGISVDYLEKGFLKEVEEAGWDRTATIGELEGLQIKERAAPVPFYLQVDDEDKPAKPKRPTGTPVIFDKGAHVLCPIDGQTGAAYVHCLLNDNGESVVGFANLLAS